jgi:hypothetical protein
MRAMKCLLAAVAVGALAIGCSDDGDNGQASSDGGGATTTMDLSGAADTPFCEAVVESMHAFEDGLNNEAAGSSDRADGLLEEFKTKFESVAAAAPPEIQADMTTTNQSIQSVESWPGLFTLSEAQYQAWGRVNAFINSTCNLDLEESPRGLGG